MDIITLQPVVVWEQDIQPIKSSVPQEVSDLYLCDTLPFPPSCSCEAGDSGIESYILTTEATNILMADIDEAIKQITEGASKVEVLYIHDLKPKTYDLSEVILFQLSDGADSVRDVLVNGLNGNRRMINMANVREIYIKPCSTPLDQKTIQQLENLRDYISRCIIDHEGCKFMISRSQVKIGE